MSEDKKKGFNFSDKEKFLVKQAILYSHEKFGKLTAKDKNDPFTLKTIIEYYHDKQPMSPMLHDLKKEVFAKLDEFAGKKLKTFNELFAEEKRDKAEREAKALKERVQKSRRLATERNDMLKGSILRPGKVSITVPKKQETFVDSEVDLEVEKKDIVEKKEFKPGIRPEDKEIYTLDDVLEGL